MARLFVRVDFEPSGSALGPGMAQLLELVAEKGSIRAAAAAIGMSYRKAWLLIQNLQKTFNGEVVTASAGGTAGGGTQLTALGIRLVALYRQLERRASEATELERASLAALVQENAPPRRGARKTPRRA